MEPKGILVEGKNCWRIAHAKRVSFLIDGAAYFAAFAAAVEQARKSIFVIGWNIDGQVRLRRDGNAGNLPSELGRFLNAVLSRRRSLRAYLLEWDFAMIFALDRELLPLFGIGWPTHQRLDFRLDSHHPAGGSHHQKIAVIDDAVAFVGGLDFSKCYWDTSEHRAHEPRRVDPGGRPYFPFHDVQMAVDGEAAAALGELARERWRRATGQRLQAPKVRDSDPWPSDLEPDMENVPVAIARTEPAYGENPGVHEVEALYLDAIAAAQQFIYMENQYFTSAAISAALAQRLQEDNGPEVVLVLPKEGWGWLEENTMGVLRARCLRSLRKADRFGHLRVYFPVVPDLRSAHIVVHSKLMVVDDRLVRVGSANLTNRSMGLDSECDLAVEARGNPRLQRAVARFRNRLLGEHLGVDPEKVEELLTPGKSLVTTVEKLRGRPRTLEPLSCKVPDWMESLVPEANVIDPEHPIDPQKLIDDFVSRDVRESAKSRWLRPLLVLLLLLALAAAWRWTPLQEKLDFNRLAEGAAALREYPGTPLLVVGAYIVGSLVLIPVTLLIVLTALTFDPVRASAYALTGCLLSSVLTYGLGHVLGRDTVRRLAGSRLNRVSRLLGRRGLITMIAARVLPLAPFTIINLVAGASHISFWDFLRGTFFGMLPGIVAITVFEHRLENAIRQPDTGNILILAAILAAAAGGIYWLRQHLKKVKTAGKPALENQRYD